MKKLNYFQKGEVTKMRKFTLSVTSDNFEEVIKNARKIYVAVNMLTDDLGDVVYVRVSQVHLFWAITDNFSGIDFDKIKVDPSNGNVFVN
tara:strand:+ start:253 stop:522 length:270 start_codon:yes stop_codon:yes gene_type:complete